MEFQPERALTVLKCVYKIKKRLYIYSIMNFLPYPETSQNKYNLFGWGKKRPIPYMIEKSLDIITIANLITFPEEKILKFVSVVK